MEKYYQKKIGNTYTKIETSSNSSEGFTSEKSKNLFKEIYSNIAEFKRLVYDAKKEIS